MSCTRAIFVAAPQLMTSIFFHFSQLQIKDVTRQIKKAVVASDLQELQKKSAEKFSKQDLPQIHLDSDGTEIDDEDYFQTLEPNTELIAVFSGEQWIDVSLILRHLSRLIAIRCDDEKFFASRKAFSIETRFQSMRKTLSKYLPSAVDSLKGFLPSSSKRESTRLRFTIERRFIGKIMIPEAGALLFTHEAPLASEERKMKSKPLRRRSRNRPRERLSEDFQAH